MSGSEITFTRGEKPPILVVSHERSGTHFTMNSIAGCFGYMSKPWLDLDRPRININYYAPQDLQTALLQLGAVRPKNILKSHHDFEFFTEILRPVGEAWTMVYVYRHPADVMISYWRLLNTLHWNEGPKAATAFELAAGEPAGRLARYQQRQHASMLDRWAAHVQGWMDAAERIGGVRLVRYEALAADFEATIRDLGERIGQAPIAFRRPSKEENVVKAGSLPFTPAPGADDRRPIAELALERHPQLMARLGYGELALAASA